MVTTVPPPDLALFFKLSGALHLYVNERFKMLPDVRTSDELAAVKVDDRIKLRDATYDNPEVFDKFIASNPAGLTVEEISEVKGWSGFIRGDFYVLRHLKNYTVFLATATPARVFGVVGLTTPLDQTFPSHALPILVKAVLLPFRRRVVWDGFVTSQNFSFGPGIRADLNETFQRLKQREGIIMSLTPRGEAKTSRRPPKSLPDLRPIVRKVMEASEQLRPGATPIQSRAFGLVRAAAQLAEAASNDPSDLDTIGVQIRAISRAYKQLVSAYERELYEGNS